MATRRASRIVNGSASNIIVRPIAVLAARVLGPGPTRLKLVKLAHNLGSSATVVDLPGVAMTTPPFSGDPAPGEA